MLLSHIRRAAVAAVATLTALAPLNVVAPSHAQTAGNIVYVGDSFTSNPDGVLNTFRGSSLIQDPTYPNKAGCLQAHDNAPRRLANITGRHVDDWSCTAQTSSTAMDRLKRAAAAGDLSPSTAVVIYPPGMNDYGPFGFQEGHNPFNYPEVRQQYYGNLKNAANYIRSIAPNARIIIPGQLPVTGPGDVYCAVNVIPEAPLGLPIGLLRMAEDSNQLMQREGAKMVGGEFIDIRAAGAGHHSCAGDHERFVAGIIDTTSPGMHMYAHPTAAGSQFVAEQIAARL